MASRARLIQAATFLFSEKGYEGTTVKNIAESAGVNISLISYHFDGKDGLYRACLEKFGKTQLAASERILNKPETLEEFEIRLQLFVEEFFETHLREPELVRIITRECDLQGRSSIAADIFRDIFLKNYENVVNFFAFALKKGFLRKGIDPKIMGSLFFAGLVHFIQKDPMNEMYFGTTLRDRKYREEVIRQVISFCLLGCVNLQTKPAKGFLPSGVFHEHHA